MYLAFKEDNNKTKNSITISQVKGKGKIFLQCKNYNNRFEATFYMEEYKQDLILIFIEIF